MITINKYNKNIKISFIIWLSISLALPLFDYCSVAWSKCPNTTKDILVRQHKRMARIVLGVDTQTSTDFVLNQLNWTTIEDRWKHLRCKLVYRSLNGQAPEYLTHLFNKSISVHNYRTRTAVSDGLIVPRARTNAGKQAFSHCGAIEWNQLPVNVRNASSKQAFSANFWRTVRLHSD